MFKNLVEFILRIVYPRNAYLASLEYRKKRKEVRVLVKKRNTIWISDSDNIEPNKNYLKVVASLTKAKKELSAVVKKIQKKCKHRLVEIFEIDKDYNPGFYKEDTDRSIFSGHKCIRCNLFIPRKVGRPWQVCHKCGNDKMERCEYKCYKEQSRYGSIYRCSKCYHEYVRALTDE